MLTTTIIKKYIYIKPSLIRCAWFFLLCEYERYLETSVSNGVCAGYCYNLRKHIYSLDDT